MPQGRATTAMPIPRLRQAGQTLAVAGLVGLSPVAAAADALACPSTVWLLGISNGTAGLLSLRAKPAADRTPEAEESLTRQLHQLLSPDEASRHMADLKMTLPPDELSQLAAVLNDWAMLASATRAPDPVAFADYAGSEMAKRQTATLRRLLNDHGCPSLSDRSGRDVDGLPAPADRTAGGPSGLGTAIVGPLNEARVSATLIVLQILFLAGLVQLGARVRGRRRRYDCDIPCHVILDDEIVEGRVLNLSKTGCLISGGPGREAGVRFVLGVGSHYRAAHITRTAEDTVAATFDTPLDRQTLVELLGEDSGTKASMTSGERGPDAAYTAAPA